MSWKHGSWHKSLGAVHLHRPLSKARDLGEDFVGGFRPDEGFADGIGRLDVGDDRGREPGDVRKRTAPQRLGFQSSVRTITASTCASVIVRGAPGRGSSYKPSIRCARNRWRHLQTVVCDRCSRRATTVLSWRAAHANTMRARRAGPAAVRDRRASDSNRWRSSSVRMTAGLGRPVRMRTSLYRSTHPQRHLFQLLPRAVSIGVLASVLACGVDEPDAIGLSDAISAAAIRLRQSNESKATVEYQLKLNESSLIAAVPSTGIDPRAIPVDSTADQRAKLEEAVKMWPGQTFLAIAWSQGLSSGPAIGRNISLRQQVAVLKPPRGHVSVVLERGDDGQVVIVALK